MRRYVLFVFIFAFACNQKQSAPIIGTWKCISVKRIETPAAETEAMSLGKELVVSEKVSDSLIIQSDTAYEEHNSAFGMHRVVKGTYILGRSAKSLLLTKNDDAPGTERSKEFLIVKHTPDTLLLSDADGFQFIYLRQQER